MLKRCLVPEFKCSALNPVADEFRIHWPSGDKTLREPRGASQMDEPWSSTLNRASCWEVESMNRCTNSRLPSSLIPITRRSTSVEG